MSIESQKQKIITHLKERGSIMPISALNLYGCFRLGARIFDLREDGFDIETEIVTYKGKRFAKYTLKTDKKCKNT